MKLKKLSLALSLLCGISSFTQAAEAVGTTLEDFFTAALDYSPTMKAAQATRDVGDARVNFANGQLLPQVSASANVSDNTRQETLKDPTDYRGRRYAVQLSQVLFNWQAFIGRQQAYLQKDQFEAQYYLRLAQVLTEVADNYLLVLQAEDVLNSTRLELDAINNQLNQIQRMSDLQLAKITDLYNGQAQQAAVKTLLVDAESELTIRKENLRATTGLDVGRLNRLPDAINVVPLEGSLEEWLARVDANNKQIEASELALEIANKTVSARRGAYMPKFSLVLQRSTSDVGFENFPITRADNNYIGVDFSMPLFAGGSNRASVREAMSMRDIAESDLAQTNLTVRDRARTAYFQVKAGESRVEAARLLAQATTSAATGMQRGFELGTETSVNLLNAIRDQFRAQRDLQRARYDLIRHTLVLEREAGTLDPADLERVSAMLDTPSPRADN